MRRDLRLGAAPGMAAERWAHSLVGVDASRSRAGAAARAALVARLYCAGAAERGARGRAGVVRSDEGSGVVERMGANYCTLWGGGRISGLIAMRRA